MQLIQQVEAVKTSTVPTTLAASHSMTDTSQATQTDEVAALQRELEQLKEAKSVSSNEKKKLESSISELRRKLEDAIRFNKNSAAVLKEPLEELLHEVKEMAAACAEAMEGAMTEESWNPLVAYLSKLFEEFCAVKLAASKKIYEKFDPTADLRNAKAL